MNYSDLSDNERARERLHNKFFGLLALVGFTLMLGTAVVAELDNNDTEIRIQTDMIAACSASSDVVGCLEALQG